LISDIGNAKAGMKGRLAWQAFLLIGEGISIFILANVHTLGGAITIMTIFGLFCQAANGSAFGIVPYINPPVTGSISGIVGAGGNLGAVFFGLGFRNLTEHQAFNLMAAVVLVAGVSTACISIKGHRGLICGQDSPEVIAAWKKLGSTNGTLTVPEKDVEVSDGKDTDKNSEAEFNQFMEYVSEKNITVEK
jgi:NNP family nitrate/nitrite transporter-like MFS transporter